MRRPSISAAGGDFAFALLALASGWAGGALALAALVFAASVAVWAWTRRDTLAAMAPSRRFASSAVAIGVMALVLGGAYWLGLILGGHG